ncbi:MAG: hypothetical protein AABX71_01750 [Nanoarchaeota archaeon]
MKKNLEKLVAVLLGVSAFSNAGCARQIREEDLFRVPEQSAQVQSSAVQGMHYLKEFPEYALVTRFGVYGGDEIYDIEGDRVLGKLIGYEIGVYRENRTKKIYRAVIFDFGKSISLEEHLEHLTKKSGTKLEILSIQGKPVYLIRNMDIQDYGTADMAYIPIGNKLLRITYPLNSPLPQQLIEAYLDKE